MPLSGMGRQQEAGEAGAEQGGGAPRPGGDAVVQPERAQGQGEDELGDQDRLDGGQLPEVEGERR